MPAKRLTLTQVHKYQQVPDAPQEVRLVEENHYIRLREGEGPNVFLQNGRIWWEDGTVVPKNQLPDWFEDKFKKLSIEAKTTVGFGEGAEVIQIPVKVKEPAETEILTKEDIMKMKKKKLKELASDIGFDLDDGTVAAMREQAVAAMEESFGEGPWEFEDEDE